jgi:SMC interacting uncharacterized protein involved in chromosome segregation
MPNPIKMSESDLTEIRTFQEKLQTKMLDFGKLYLEKMQIDQAIKAVAEKEQAIQDEWNALQLSEKELIEKLLKTYGEGQLNLSEGTFTPDK